VGLPPLSTHGRWTKNKRAMVSTAEVQEDPPAVLQSMDPNQTPPASSPIPVPQSTSAPAEKQKQDAKKKDKLVSEDEEEEEEEDDQSVQSESLSESSDSDSDLDDESEDERREERRNRSTGENVREKQAAKKQKANDNKTDKQAVHASKPPVQSKPPAQSNAQAKKPKQAADKPPSAPKPKAVPPPLLPPTHTSDAAKRRKASVAHLLALIDRRRAEVGPEVLKCADEIVAATEKIARGGTATQTLNSLSAMLADMCVLFATQGPPATTKDKGNSSANDAALPPSNSSSVHREYESLLEHLLSQVESVGDALSKAHLNASRKRRRDK